MPLLPDPELVKELARAAIAEDEIDSLVALVETVRDRWTRPAWAICKPVILHYLSPSRLAQAAALSRQASAGAFFKSDVMVDFLEALLMFDNARCSIVIKLTVEETVPICQLIMKWATLVYTMADLQYPEQNEGFVTTMGNALGNIVQTDWQGIGIGHNAPFFKSFVRAWLLFATIPESPYFDKVIEPFDHFAPKVLFQDTGSIPAGGQFPHIHDNSMWPLMREHAEEIATVLLKSYWRLLGTGTGPHAPAPAERAELIINHLTPFLSLPKTRSALIRRGVVTFLCHYARRFVRGELTVTIMSTSGKLGILHNIGTHLSTVLRHPIAVAEALEARILPTVARLLAVADNNANNYQDDSGELLTLLTILRAYAHFPSLTSGIKKNLRYMIVLEEQGGFGNAVRRHPGWGVLVEIRGTGYASEKLPGKKRCLNQKCSSPPETNVLKSCVKCGLAEYCSEKCQRVDWTEGKHCVHCPRLQKMRRNGSLILPLCTRDARAAMKVLKLYLVQPFLAGDALMRTQVSDALRRARENYQPDWHPLDDRPILMVELMQMKPIGFSCASVREMRENQRFLTMPRSDFDNPAFDRMVERKRSKSLYVCLVVSRNLLYFSNMDEVMEETATLEPIWQ
ncbi:hypothetical protein CYLTODRAFT_452110 [Cylindrobasidium torrendii FP15055 ss-10]|uniref:MYND-type domain-containing protein n=1 Tax=Cylindrobasidium torrendii FP15055 ss-10 TaxID=1314674 RepID=A0A0D7BIR7_9AGAR|nr:hypothetical protein CYLTODRAFT_452110 [Cylindrobasidium torrendii FP15055 ss-10]